MLRATVLNNEVLPIGPSGSGSPVEIATGPTALEELQGRLALIAPVILQGIYAARKQQGTWMRKLSAIVLARRNAASHCFCTTASVIGNMSQRALSAVPRGRRKPAPAPAPAVSGSGSGSGRCPSRVAYRQCLPWARLAFLTIAWGFLGLAGLALQASSPMFIASAQSDAEALCCRDLVPHMPEEMTLQRHLAKDVALPIPEILRSILPLMEEQFSVAFEVGVDIYDDVIDFVEMLRHSPTDWTKEQVVDFFQEADADNNGVLYHDEFLNAFMELQAEVFADVFAYDDYTIIS